MEQPIQTNPDYYVIDTSFLRSLPHKLHWTTVGQNHLQAPNAKAIIPKGVNAEWNSFLAKSGVEEFVDVKKTLADQLGIKVKGYGSKLNLTLSRQFDAQIKDSGLEEKALNGTDKTILQAAYELETSGKNVTIITGDQGIHEQAYNAWKSDGKDIHTISPWTPPSKPQDLNILLSERVLDEMRHVAMQDKSHQKFMAVAQGLNYGKHAYDVAFGWYVNKTHQFSPPKIDGVYYIRMIQLPHSASLTTLGVYAMKKFGFFVLEPRPQLWILENKTPFTHSHVQKLSSGSYVQCYINELEWSRVDTMDLMRHTPITNGHLVRLKKTLQACK